MLKMKESTDQDSKLSERNYNGNHEASSTSREDYEAIKVKSTVSNNEVANSETEASGDSQEVHGVFKWIERKLDILKILQKSDDNQLQNNSGNQDERIATKKHWNISLNDKSAVLEEMLEEIQKMTSTDMGKSDYLSKEVITMLDMLQETTLGLLDSFNQSRTRCPTIKVLATLIQHLSASVGNKVTFLEVQECINGKRVMVLYGDVQSAKEPRSVKLVTVKKYLDHGIDKTEVLRRKSKSHSRKVDWTISECRTAINVISANETLKQLTRESENILLKYAGLVSFLTTKAKSFVTIKNDIERLLSNFMTKEIQDLYET